MFVLIMLFALIKLKIIFLLFDLMQFSTKLAEGGQIKLVSQFFSCFIYDRIFSAHIKVHFQRLYFEVLFYIIINTLVPSWINRR